MTSSPDDGRHGAADPLERVESAENKVEDLGEMVGARCPTVKEIGDAISRGGEELAIRLYGAENVMLALAVLAAREKLRAGGGKL